MQQQYWRTPAEHHIIICAQSYVGLRTAAMDVVSSVEMKRFYPCTNVNAYETCQDNLTQTVQNKGVKTFHFNR